MSNIGRDLCHSGLILLVICLALMDLALSATPSPAQDSVRQQTAIIVRQIVDRGRSCPKVKGLPQHRFAIFGVDPRSPRVSQPAAEQLLARVRQEFERIAEREPVLLSPLDGIPELVDQVWQRFGERKGSEFLQAVSKYDADLHVLPVPQPAPADEVNLLFIVVDRALQCERYTDTIRLSFDERSGILAGDGEVTPAKLVRDAVRTFMTKAGDVKRMLVLPTLYGSRILDKEDAQPIESLLASELMDASVRIQPATRDAVRAQSLIVRNLWWALERLDGDGREGDWVVQVHFAGKPHQLVGGSIAFAPTGRKTSQARIVHHGDIPERIFRPRFAGPAALVLERVKAPPPTTAAASQPPAFAIKAAVASYVYCLSIGHYGQFLPLTPAPSNDVAKTARLMAREAPYRFPGDLSETADRSHHFDAADSTLACFATPRPVSDHLTRPWAGPRPADKGGGRQRMADGILNFTLRQFGDMRDLTAHSVPISID